MNEPRPRCWFCDEPILPSDATIIARELGLRVHRDCYRDVADGAAVQPPRGPSA
jgi:hypothetical protein